MGVETVIYGSTVCYHARAQPKVADTRNLVSDQSSKAFMRTSNSHSDFLAMQSFHNKSLNHQPSSNVSLPTGRPSTLESGNQHLHRRTVTSTNVELLQADAMAMSG